MKFPQQKILSLLTVLVWSVLCAAQADQQTKPVQEPSASERKATDEKILELGKLQAGSVVFGGLPRQVIFDAKLCSVPAGLGMAVGASPGVLEIDPARSPTGWTEISLVPRDRACGENETRLRVAVTGWHPGNPPRGASTIWYDSGVADVKLTLPGPARILSVVEGIVEGAGDCPQPQACPVEPGDKFLRALAERAERADLVVWPADVPVAAGQTVPLVVDGRGSVLNWKDLSLGITRIVFGNPLIEAGRLDTTDERQLVRSRFLRAIERISCDNAECRLTRKGILVFDVDPAAPAVRLGYTLKDGFVLKSGQKTVNQDTVSMKLERCSIRAPREVPLLDGAGNHRIFVKIPTECTRADPANLEISTRPPSRTYVRAELPAEDPSVRLLELVIDRVPSGSDRISLTLFERIVGLRRLGSLRLPIAGGYRPAQIRFDVPEIGLIDFIPSNRPARLSFGFGDPVWAERFSVEPRPGFYGISRQEGTWTVLGEAGVTGNIPLHFAYRPAGFSAFVGNPEKPDAPPPIIATFDTESVYPVRAINVPMSLTGAAGGEDLFEVVCGAREDAHPVASGKLVRIPFEKRDTCRLVFHRNRIPAQVGTQRLRVQAGEFNQIISLSPGSGTLRLSIPVGDRNEYEKVTVSVAHDMLSGHYTLQNQQSLGEEARYRIMLSDSWWRVSATTALPTGMFRFGSGSSEGTVPLSAGALSRINYIQSDGRDFPLGLEAGLFATNLSGQPDFSIVMGAGLSIPVLNPDTALQASFNIHAWVEYAPTRLDRDEGTFAFLFGPSFTVGRLSTTF